MYCYMTLAMSVSTDIESTKAVQWLIISDADTAITEFSTLLKDLESTGLHTEVRAGHDESLLVFVQAPRELLGNMVHHSR